MRQILLVARAISLNSNWRHMPCLTYGINLIDYRIYKMFTKKLKVSYNVLNDQQNHTLNKTNTNTNGSTFI